MLMLGVKPGDYIMIDGKIKIRVVETGMGFRLGIEAPKEMRILRSSIYEQENPDYVDEDFDALRQEKKERKRNKVITPV